MALGMQPSLFGNNYSQAGLEITDALQNPGEEVKAAINFSKQGVSADTQIIPMLQDGNDSGFNNSKAYTKAQIDAQISAAKELGIDEYILYNADGEYLLK